MRYENRTLNKKISDAIAIANDLFDIESKMMREIQGKNDFKFNSGNGATVCVKILNCKTVAPVYFYKPLNPFTKALGYSDSKAIHLNSRKIDSLSFNELVGLLCHEYLHLCGLGHGNNYKTRDKILYSVNYFCSEGISQGKWL